MPGYGFRPFIQWLEVASSGSVTVRGIVELPVDAGRAELTYLNGWWHLVAVTAIGKKRVLFELGPPTEVRGGPDS